MQQGRRGHRKYMATVPAPLISRISLSSSQMESNAFRKRNNSQREVLCLKDPTIQILADISTRARSKTNESVGVMRPVDRASMVCALSTEDGYKVEFVEWLAVLFAVWDKWTWKINVRKDKTCLVTVIWVQTIHILNAFLSVCLLCVSLRSVFASRYSPIVASSFPTPIFRYLPFQVFLDVPFQLLRRRSQFLSSSTLDLTS